DGGDFSLTPLENEPMSNGAGVSTGFPELFDFCNSLMLEEGPAIEDRSVRARLSNYWGEGSGRGYNHHRPQGAAGGLSGPEDAEVAGKFQAMLLRAPGTRVEGGTDEIMRNIIAERVLGLPGDIRVDKDVPFNKIPTKGRA